jgi:hypothetical protein
VIKRPDPFTPPAFSRLRQLEEPDDVARERQKVYDAQIDADCPVIIRDLRKEYGARFGYLTSSWSWWVGAD